MDPAQLALAVDIAVRLAIAGSIGWLGNWLTNKGSTKEQKHFDSRALRGAASIAGMLLVMMSGLWAVVGVGNEVRAFRASDAEFFVAARPSLEDEFPIVLDQIDAFELCRGDFAILAARSGQSADSPLNEPLGNLLCASKDGELAWLIRYQSGWRFTDQSCFIWSCINEEESSITEWLRPDGLKEKCTRPKDGEERCVLLPAG